MAKLRIRLPKPHNIQRQIIDCTKQFIVINAGRRAGKTHLTAIIAVIKAQLGKKVLYVSPVSSQSDSFWELITDWLGNAIALKLVRKNESKRRIDFNSGGRIECRTAHKPDNLRGTWGDFIILDEYAFMDEDVWKKVCQPMLLDNNGTVIFISTPNLRNHFYHLYLHALNYPEKWAVFTFSSLDNPYLSKEALESMIVNMTDEDYQQEIMAQFLQGEGAIFRLDRKDFYEPQDIEIVIAQHKGHRLCAGLDWGQKNDFTCLSVGCADCRKELLLKRLNKIDYPTQREFVKHWIFQFGQYVELLAEENSIGLPNIEQLMYDGVDVSTFTTTNASKGSLVQQLRLSLFQHDWKWIYEQYAWNELESYEMKVTPAGNRTYNAPTGLNDDSVMARMLMLNQAITGRYDVFVG